MGDILSSAVGVAVVTGLFKLLEFWLNRRAKKKDDAQTITAATCRARGEELADIKNALIVILHDRIKHLAKTYISRSYITVEEYEDLQGMHEVYHALGGNGFLNELMRTVAHLEKRAR